MKEKLQEKIDLYQSVLDKSIESHSTSLDLSPRIVKNSIESKRWLFWLNVFYDNIERKESMIGQEVYKMKNNFTYNTLDFESYSVLNKIECKVLFTKELFEQFLDDYLDFLIKRLESNIKKNKLYSSTCKVTNLLNHLEFESDIDIIKFLIELQDERKK